MPAKTSTKKSSKKMPKTKGFDAFCKTEPSADREMLAAKWKTMSADEKKAYTKVARSASRKKSAKKSSKKKSAKKSSMKQSAKKSSMKKKSSTKRKATSSKKSSAKKVKTSS